MMLARRLAILTSMLAAAAWPAAAEDIKLSERRSSYREMLPETRAMQDDDASNPGMLWVKEGEALWSAAPRDGARSCAACHGDAPASMRGVAVRHPAFDPGRQRVVSLEGRIDQCRTERQGMPPLAYESDAMLGLTAFVARQSRGLAIEIDGVALAGAIDGGRQLYRQRQGQLNLSCANCHDDNWGRKLAGNTIPQAHPTGYPLYRLEWQKLGSLQRRLRNCLTGMRAESYPTGSPELIALEVYLMWRARGMTLESPAVRP